jgi:hypothetical protein
MLQECSDQKLVVPSLEGLIAGPDMPTYQLAFYDICVKSVTGNVAWRKSMKNADEDPGFCATPTDIAFAVIILENNYANWIAKGKANNFTFETEYDPIGAKGQTRLYTEVKYQFECDPKAKSFDRYLIYPDDKEAYDKVREASKEKFRKLYMQIKGTLQEQEEFDTDLDVSEDVNVCKRKRAKEERMTKKYTKGGSGRKRYGGWSIDAHKRMEQITAKVKASRLAGEYNYFERTLRQWQRQELDMDEDVEKPPEEPEHTIDREAAWDL